MGRGTTAPAASSAVAPCYSFRPSLVLRAFAAHVARRRLLAVIADAAGARAGGGRPCCRAQKEAAADGATGAALEAPSEDAVHAEADAALEDEAPELIPIA